MKKKGLNESPTFGVNMAFFSQYHQYSVNFPQVDIIQGTRESMTKRLNDILEDCRESNVSVLGLKSAH
jgi:hypothetical protein